jgi:hypothetical protein
MTAMALLTTVSGPFPARVLAARLGSEGFVWELRGNVDGPYPVGAVQVLVAASELRDAQELLLADEIDAIDIGDDDDDDDDDGADAAPAPPALWLVLVAIVSVPAFSLGRIIVGW